MSARADVLRSRSRFSLALLGAIAFFVVAGVAAAAWLRVETAVRGPLGFDFQTVWNADHALLFGAAGHLSVWSPYPLPAQLLFLPFGLLPMPAAQVAGALLTLLFLSLALVLHEEAPGLALRRALPLLLSLPVFDDVQDTHALPALALLALVLAIRFREQEKAWLLGLVAAIALLTRPINAAPVLIVCLWGLPARQLLRAGLAALLTLAPLVLAAFLVDPAWPQQYGDALRAYGSSGLYRLIATAGGFSLVALLVLALGAAGAAGVARGWNRRDLAALVMAAAVVLQPTNGVYTGIFALPALARAARREAWWPWAASGIAWAVTLGLSPWLGPGRPIGVGLLSLLAYWFVFQAYPLLRPSRA